MVSRKTKAAAKREVKESLEVFFERYSTILWAARDFLETVAKAAETSGESPYCATALVAEHVSTHMPAAYIKTFGVDEPRELKVWRLKTILSNAHHLGAYPAAGIVSSRGKGIAAASNIKGRKKHGRRLRVLKGGKS